MTAPPDEFRLGSAPVLHLRRRVAIFEKTSGPLSKRTELGTVGIPLSNGGECRMAEGVARTASVVGVIRLAETSTLMPPATATVPRIRAVAGIHFTPIGHDRYATASSRTP